MDRSTGVRILFSGQYWPGANSLYIARAFERCGSVVRWLNDTSLVPAWERQSSRIIRRFLHPLIEWEWNRQLMAQFNTFQPDLVYITNADLCWPPTLQAIRQKKVPVMCFYHDVQWKNRPGSRFSEVITEFDLVATTRRWQEVEFKAAGTRAVAVVRFGYEPAVHRPLQLDQSALDRYEAEVTFIGTRELQRQADLEALVSKEFPCQFNLWGNWSRLPRSSPLHKYWQGRPVFEQEIPIIYAASQVALHWVGWDARGSDMAMRSGDQHNSRTFQIAACGGAMMLAQRTAEHRQFFEEDKEAIFFSDVPELRQKLDYWLSPERERERKQVASAARERCLKEDYTYTPVVRQLLSFFSLPTL